MNDENPYAPPVTARRVELSKGSGSIERAVRGDYHVDVGEIVREAWRLTEGFKLTCNLAGIAAAFIGGVADALLTAMTGLDSGEHFEQGEYALAVAVIIGSTFVLLPLTAPLEAGLAKLGMQRAVGGDPEVPTLFRYFSTALPFAALGFVVAFATLLGTVLLVVPGMYLAVGLALANYLMADRGLSPLQAMAVSLKAIHHQWFAVAGVFAVVFLCILGGLLTCGVGLIWTYPLSVAIGGVLYKTIFGVENPELD